MSLAVAALPPHAATTNHATCTASPDSRVICKPGCALFNHRHRSSSKASAVEMATLRWIDWFNNHRLFSPIGHIPPVEAEANYYAARETLDMVA